MRTALIAIATGFTYREYARQMFDSADKFFPSHHKFIFTDEILPFAVRPDARGESPSLSVVYTEDRGYPRTTLMRYRTILKAQRSLEQYDQVFYVDADMKFVSSVEDEIFSDGITATLHPGYVGGRGTPETNSRSYAFCSTNAVYYCGGFNGGNAKSFLSMAEELANDIDVDDRRGVMAVWHDESHLNRYLASHPPAKVLGPEYCYPENAGDYYKNKWRAAGLGEVEPKLIALTKTGR